MSQLQKQIELTAQEIQTLAQAGVIPQNTPPAVVKVFAIACQQHGLSPFKKEIYLVKYSGRNGDTYSTIVGIDGLRAKADRTGQLAGKDDAKFDLMPDGSFKTAAQLISEKKRPTSCTVTVYRAIGGMRCPFTKTVLFNEYCPASPPPGSKWLTMPFNQIEKCAEAHALRMGFASETGTLNIEEESAAIQDVTISAAKSIIPNSNKGQQVIELNQSLIDEVEACTTVEALQNVWYSQAKHLAGKAKDKYSAIVKHKKEALLNGN